VCMQYMAARGHAHVHRRGGVTGRGGCFVLHLCRECVGPRHPHPHPPPHTHPAACPWRCTSVYTHCIRTDTPTPPPPLTRVLVYGNVRRRWVQPFSQPSAALILLPCALLHSRTLCIPSPPARAPHHHKSHPPRVRPAVCAGVPLPRWRAEKVALSLIKREPILPKPGFIVKSKSAAGLPVLMRPKPFDAFI
jgi:hypothetical protein